MSQDVPYFRKIKKDGPKRNHQGKGCKVAFSTFNGLMIDKANFKQDTSYIWNKNRLMDFN